MTLSQVSTWTELYTGDRSGISYDGEHLHVPDDLVDDAAAVDTSANNSAYLALQKSNLKAAVDQQAERERLKYITAGAGQAMTYAQKAEEARLCLDATGPDPEDYPLLAAEIGITASTLVGVAQVVATANAQWLQIGAAIEAARLSAKKAISEAETVEDAQAAADAIVWP
uniref:DUF4376 domain-containing protein n=1 Tax=Agrobacterium albertimagni TaxID=147266 RepID=A0A7C1SVU7_9HYPH